MIRTATIHSSRLEDFLSELRKCGELIKNRGGAVTIDDREGYVELDGVKLKLIGNGPYIISIEGKDSKTEDINDLAELFKEYGRSK